jgi:polysaccharide export outer membrane protein
MGKLPGTGKVGAIALIRAGLCAAAMASLSAPVSAPVSAQVRPATVTPSPATGAAPAPAPAPAGRAATQKGYVLGPGDAITVVVYGQEAFNVATRIKPDGTISMPLIGQVQASGRTVVTLADEVARQLSRANFLRDPIVNVEITEYRSQTVRVVGAVSRPGIQPLDQPYTLLDVLLRAGWVRGEGARTIYVRRPGEEEMPIDIERLLRADPEADIEMVPGVTVFVPEAELVYVMGGAARPGGYPLTEGMTAGKLLLMAGGSATGGRIRSFTLERNGQRLEGADKETVLQPGDVIMLRGGF